MNLIKKTLLIFTGIVISLVILEILLQIIGFGLTTVKEYKNKKLKDSNTITILCLGESTTEGQWPPILQEILNKKAKHKKFIVIDEGHIAKNSEYIYYEVIEKKLNFYKPEVVIGMIGVNDAMSDKPYIIKNTDFKLKTYKLLVLLKDHMMNKHTVNLNNAARNDHIPNTVIEKLSFNANINDSIRSLDIMKKIVHDYPDIHYYETIIPALVNPYFSEIVAKKDKNYIFSIEDFIDYYKISGHCLELDKTYLLFAKNFFAIKNYYNAILCAKMALKYNSNCLISVKSIIDMEKNLNLNVTIPNGICREQEYPGSYLITDVIYPKIADKVFESGAQLIAMQYPTLPISLLKENLNKSKYYNAIIFISNEMNFKKTLKTKNIHVTDIFIDMFHGAFGHCTKLGNTLIAENAAETIISLYDKE